MLGETSLERKCRFLFGSGLLLLITGSFYFYARQTTSLVFEQNTIAARQLVPAVILERHYKWSEGLMGVGLDSKTLQKNVERMAVELKPDDLKDFSWSLMKADLRDPTARPQDTAGYRAIEQLSPENLEVIQVLRERQEYHYYRLILATESCIACHRVHNERGDLDVGDELGVVKVAFPLSKTYRALAWNNAVLLSTAIVTAFLAMLAAYAIVRYVIVKPVLHLKDVSDQISRGGLDVRADIRTGDEFEELSHAFNRMLRHLVNAQQELQSVNQDLDAKVDELAQVNLRLYELNNLKNEFLATMSHELRTPLNSILGFSDVLAGSPTLTDKQRRYVGHIQSSGRNLLSLINDVLDLAKIESGKMERHPVEFLVGDLIEKLVGSMMPLAEKKNLELTWDVDSQLPRLFQDSGKVQQILSNLLSNAIKFTPDGGRVRVRAERRGVSQVALVVEDTGIGIPLEEQERIFEKFRQGTTIPGQRDNLTREYEGTGLGLSIIKELSKLLGGEVLLHSEFGKGSIFTVVLPIQLSADGDANRPVRPAGLTDSLGFNTAVVVERA